MSEVERCRRLLNRAEDLRYRNPRQAVCLAEEARDTVARLDRAEVGLEPWTALQVEAWSILGSALRSVAELRQAESALLVAYAFLEGAEGGTVDPAAYARLAQRAASLRHDQGRFGEALELVDEAIGIYVEEGLDQLTARALVDRGVILGAVGRRQEAIAHLGQALDRLDPKDSPRNFLAAVHNTAFYLHELADSPEADRLALRWLRLACSCHRTFPESVNLMKLRSLLGLTSIRLGRLDEGVEELWRAHAGFKRLGASYEETKVLLHLASAYLSQGRTQAVKRVAGQLFPLLGRLRIDREVSAALMLFFNAAQAETATPDLIARVSDVVFHRPQVPDGL